MPAVRTAVKDLLACLGWPADLERAGADGQPGGATREPGSLVRVPEILRSTEPAVAFAPA
jgi:hypothetical protein